MKIDRWLSFSLTDNGDWRGPDLRWSAKDVRVTQDRPTDRLSVNIVIDIPTELIAPLGEVAIGVEHLAIPTVVVEEVEES